jgi:hypothetical protein
MGRSYQFECPKCSYKAIVSGGEDSGLDFAVQTVRCRDCRRLFDAVVKLRALAPATATRLQPKSALRKKSPPDFETVLNQLPLPASGKFKWLRFPVQCAVSPSHKVERWTDPGKCPVCGSFLEKNGLPFRIWE